jgi:hypothetical protein
MGIQRVALEDHRNIPFLRRKRGDILVSNQDAPDRRGLQPGNHAERGALAAAGRAHQNHEFSVGDLQVQPLRGDVAVRVGLSHSFQPHGSHG